MRIGLAVKKFDSKVAATLSRWLGTRERRTDPITPDNVIDDVIAFANGDGNPDVRSFMNANEDDEGSVSYSIDEEDPSNEFGLRVIEVTEGIAEQHARKSIEWHRTRAKEMLASAARAPASLQKHLFEQRDLWPRAEVVMRPSLQRSSGATVAWGVEGPDHTVGWVLFAGFVILAEANDTKTSIGRCRWHGCSRFFRVKREGRGKPAREYCPGTDHAKRARPSSTERVKAWRAKSGQKQNRKKAQTLRSS